MYDQQVTVSAEDQSILHLLSLVAVGAAGCQMDEEMSRFPEWLPCLAQVWGEDGFGVWGDWRGL